MHATGGHTTISVRLRSEPTTFFLKTAKAQPHAPVRQQSPQRRRLSFAWNTAEHAGSADIWLSGYLTPQMHWLQLSLQTASPSDRTRRGLLLQLSLMRTAMELPKAEGLAKIRIPDHTSSDNCSLGDSNDSVADWCLCFNRCWTWRAS